MAGSELEKINNEATTVVGDRTLIKVAKAISHLASERRKRRIALGLDTTTDATPGLEILARVSVGEDNNHPLIIPNLPKTDLNTGERTEAQDLSEQQAPQNTDESTESK